MNSGQEAADLYFDHFDFSLPQGATIQAFKILIEGHAVGEEKPYELNVTMVDENHVPISINYAQKVSKGKSWPAPEKEKQWKYGIINEDWLSEIDAALINSNEWKVHLSLKNNSDEVLEVSIDQLSVEVFYTPLYTLCKEDCGIVFVEDQPGAYTYEWILPEGMEITSQPVDHHIVNFMMTDRNFGIKEICVEITAPDGEKKTLCRDILFINCTPSVIGDFVWLDSDGDGLQGGGEPALEGIPMILKNENDEALDTLYTDSLGYYAFVDVAPGTYYVESLYEGSLIPTAYNAGGDSLADNSFSLIGEILRTTLFSIDFDETYGEADLGLIPGASLGDFVWEDSNGNGVQDAGETGIESIKVLLYSNNELIDSLFTDAEGNFDFDRLYPGSYQLCIDLPPGAQAAPQMAGSADIDSDINQEGCTESIQLFLGETKTDVDAGIIYFGSIGDYVWHDLNEDGLQNDGDTSALANISIGLYDADDEQLLQLSFSDQEGFYTFNDLLPGNYYLVYETTELLQATLQFAGTDTEEDSDIFYDNTIMRSPVIQISSGDQRQDIDAGFVPLKSGIGDYVWLDLNEDGIQDSDEEGINGVEIHLYDASGNFIQSTLSENGPQGLDGYYAFQYLVPGDYYIQVVLPEIYLFTLANQGSPESDSDINEVNGEASSQTFTLLPDEYKDDLDVGLIYNYGSIGDYVWLDLDEDGVQDDLEYGLNDIKLYLLNENEERIDSTISLIEAQIGVYGYYLFEKVIPGQYYIELQELEEGYEPSPAQSGDSELDSDLAESGPPFRTTIFTLEPGEDKRDIDAGLLLKNASIKGLTWFDDNENGSRETGENVLTGLSVDLYSESGTLIGNTFTDADGKYAFTGLSMGNYYLLFESRDEWLFTLPFSGMAQNDSDVSSANGFGSTDLLTLSLSEEKINIDAGYVHNYGTIGDQVWLDLNENALFDNGEVGIENIEIQLFDDMGQWISSTQTDDLGNYLFEQVIPGSYYLYLEFPEKYTLTQADLGDEQLDSDFNGGNGLYTTDLFTVEGGEQRIDLDAGLIGKPIIIGDWVWLDSNRNALQDGDEIGMNGLTVELYDPTGLLLQSTTTANHPDTGEEGYYLFQPLLPGEYYLRLLIPDDFIATEPGVGNEEEDSDLGEAFGLGTSDLYSFDYGQELLNIDFGLVYKTASVGDYLWKDLNENGIQDDGNSGIDNVVLYLYNESEELIRTTNTYPNNDTSGYYLFSFLDPGTYFIEIVLNEDLEETVAFVGDEQLDSDLISEEQKFLSPLFELSPDEHMRSIDFGVIDKRGSIGGLVWYDLDEDGLYLEGEAGISSVEVKLFDENGTLQNNTTTDDDGFYQFSSIKPGDYYLQFIIVDAYEPTLFQAGLDPSNDSDINSAIAYGSTPVITINPGDEIGDVYGGFIDKPLVLGDRIWVDENQDGIQNTGEEGLNGVEVRLYDADGQYLAVTQSDFNPQNGHPGYYAFKNMEEGSYYLRFISQDGYIATLSDSGTDDALDSDVLGIFGPGTTDTFYYDGLSDKLDMDAGYTFDTFSSIGDFVWLDENGNGLQDLGEEGINGIDIELYKSSGEFVRSTQSADDPDDGNPGYYGFDNISSGKYYVKVLLPDTLYVTIASQGSDDALDNDVNHGNGAGTTPTIDLGMEQEEKDIDIGLFELATLGDFVWEDSNSNGIQDLNEEGVNGVLVELFDLDENLISSTFTSDLGSTGASGYYLFSYLDPGQYFLKFHIDQNAEFSLFNATSDDKDSDVTGAYGAGTTSAIELLSNQVKLDVDAGISLEGGDINGYIWLDVNADGLHLTNEEGLNGILVKLMREDGSQASQIYSYQNLSSDLDGYYEFRNIPEGNYYLQVKKPDEYHFTLPNVGSDDELDSEVDGSFGPGTTPLFSIINEGVIESFNAGMYSPASIGDWVWYDDNQDGLQDADEEGAEGVMVILLENGNIPSDTTYTDGDGFYTFDGLLQGVYAVLFKAPPEYGFTARNIGSDDAIDSDAAGNGKSSLISLAHGAQFMDLDAGLVSLFNLVGNQLWLDANGDGVQDEEEEVVSGAEVSLYNDQDVFIERTFSDEFGEYWFYNLKPGQYYVKAIRNNLGPSEGDRNGDEIQFETEQSTALFLVDFDGFYEDKDIGFEAINQQNNISKDIPELLIYPNPFQNKIRIDLSNIKSRAEEVIVRDMIGNVVAKQRVGLFARQLYLNLGHLPTDNYMVSLMADKVLIGQKMIYKAEE
jgi:protocatechuate 3,4-dioxygenase beta subunit